MTPRREPLLWLQLIGLAAIPLELLLVLLLLAGSDPGPWPGLERVVIWGLGAVAPAVLLWRQPPDPLSLLLLCTPPQQRRPEQRALTREPLSVPLKLLLASGAALLLPVLWWLDSRSVLADSFALLPNGNRLLALLAVVPVLALLVWQWQQLVQATSLLLGGAEGAAEAGWEAGEEGLASNDQSQLEPRLCLGLPWLQLPALEPEPDKPPLQTPPSRPPAVAEALEITELDHQTEGVPQEGSAPLEPEAAQEPEPEAEIEGAIEPEIATEAAPEAAIEAAGAAAPEPEPEPEQEPEAALDPEAALEPEPTQEPGQDVEPQPEPDAAPKAELQPEPEPKAQTALEPEITDVAFTPIEEPELEVPTPGEPEESAAVAIEPEQAAEDDQGTNLDQPIG